MKTYSDLTDKEKKIFDGALGAVDAANNVVYDVAATGNATKAATTTAIADAVYGVFIIVKKLLLED